MVVKLSIGLGIVMFWCVMNFLLIKRQIGALPSVITLHGTEKITENVEEWWGVYYRGEKIGYATQTITPKSKGYRLYDRSVLNLNLLGTVRPATRSGSKTPRRGPGRCGRSAGRDADRGAAVTPAVA